MGDQPRILVFTGEGKGKTSAALGVALRATGHGMTVCFIQFVKDDATTGEIAASEGVAGLQIVQTGRGFVPPPTDPRFAEHKRAAEAGLRRARQAVTGGDCDLVILDEVIVAIATGLLTERAVLDVVSAARPTVCLVLTGRGATPALIAAADTVTEMRAVKHAYDAGRPPRKGVEL